RANPGFTQVLKGNPMLEQLFKELVNARLFDFRVSSREIERRMEWERLLRIDRLEAPLGTAKGRLQVARWLIFRGRRCRTPRRSGSSSALPTNRLQGNQAEV